MTKEKPHKSRSVMSWAAFVIFAIAFLYQTWYKLDNEMATYGMMFIVANFCFNKTAQLIKGTKNV